MSFAGAHSSSSPSSDRARVGDRASDDERGRDGARAYDDRGDADRGSGPDRVTLHDLINEVRVLLPGTQVFLAFLGMIPFSARFAELDGTLRAIYLVTFFATMVALVLFVVPAVYHRLARPIHDKERFKVFANKFLVAGLVPLSISMVLTSYLVTSVVSAEHALVAAVLLASLIALVWWFVPLARAHDRVGVPLSRSGHR